MLALAVLLLQGATPADPPPQAGVPYQVEQRPDEDALELPAGDEEPVDIGTSSAADTVRYTVRFPGFKEIGLEERLQEASTLWAERRTPAASRAQISRRLLEDRDIALLLLRNDGYYGANVTTHLRTDPADPAQLEAELSVEPGARYTFSAVRIQTPDDVRPLVESLLNIQTGDVVQTEAILAAEDRLRLELPKRGRPFVMLSDRDILIDHDASAARYTLQVDPGPDAVFGDLRFEGRQALRRNHMARLSRFKAGEPYDQRRIDDLREALVATGVFATVQITPERPPEGAPEPVAVPIVVRTEQAKVRTLSASLGYATDEGPNGSIGWQHRNLLGGEERFTTEAKVGTIEQSALATLELINFGRRDQSLLFPFTIKRERPLAFDADSISFGVAVTRQAGPVVQRRWVGSLGTELNATRTVDSTGERRFLLLSTPLSLRYDATDDLLNPTQGYRLGAILALDIATEDSLFSYGRFEATGSYYLPIDDDGRLVLAQRLRFGSIVGAGQQRIPATRRFYAGGGGSIRGFGFQRVGPRDAEDDPQGGRSLIELSGEIRWRITETLGIAPFLDAGNVYAGPNPELDRFRFGAGLGLRYYTSFAPVRLDIATPFRRRDGEERIAIYVSVGQSF